MHLTSTVYNVIEDRINRKYCEQLRLEARIPQNIKGLHLQRMVAYQIIALQFGQPFNRYAWVLNPPDAVKDYSSQANRTLGAILTRVVSKITSFPEGTSPLEIKKVLDRVERNIPHIAA